MPRASVPGEPATRRHSHCAPEPRPRHGPAIRPVPPRTQPPLGPCLLAPGCSHSQRQVWTGPVVLAPPAAGCISHNRGLRGISSYLGTHRYLSPWIRSERQPDLIRSDFDARGHLLIAASARFRRSLVQVDEVAQLSALAASFTERWQAASTEAQARRVSLHPAVEVCGCVSLVHKQPVTSRDSLEVPFFLDPSSYGPRDFRATANNS